MSPQDPPADPRPHRLGAAIDLGSQSALLTVGRSDGQILWDEARVVHLGEGLGARGLFKRERMEAALRELKTFAQIAGELGVEAREIRAVATSASRRALNAPNFFARVARETGIRFQVISGEEEARLTWIGATTGLRLPRGPLLVMDPGGGSTELAIGEGDHLRWRASVEVGAVRLTEAFLSDEQVAPVELARLRDHLDEALGGLTLPARPRSALAVGGTATTLAAMDLGLERWDPHRVHGHRLTAMALRNWIDRLLRASPRERRALTHLSPKRADYMLAGAAILLRALELSGRQTLMISAHGLRYALLIEALG